MEAHGRERTLTRPQTPEKKCSEDGLVGRLFRAMDTDQDGTISRDEWMKAFEMLDTKGNDVISRKEWTVMGGENHVFDSIAGKNRFAVATRRDWRDAYSRLDRDRDGAITVQEWCTFGKQNMKTNSGYGQLSSNLKASPRAQTAEIYIDEYVREPEVVRQLRRDASSEGPHRHPDYRDDTNSLGVRPAVSRQSQNEASIAASHARGFWESREQSVTDRHGIPTSPRRKLDVSRRSPRFEGTKPRRSASNTEDVLRSPREAGENRRVKSTTGMEASSSSTRDRDSNINRDHRRKAGIGDRLVSTSPGPSSSSRAVPSQDHPRDGASSWLDGLPDNVVARIKKLEADLKRSEDERNERDLIHSEKRQADKDRIEDLCRQMQVKDGESMELEQRITELEKSRARLEKEVDSMGGVSPRVRTQTNDFARLQNRAEKAEDDVNSWKEIVGEITLELAQLRRFEVLPRNNVEKQFLQDAQTVEEDRTPAGMVRAKLRIVTKTVECLEDRVNEAERKRLQVEELQGRTQAEKKAVEEQFEKTKQMAQKSSLNIAHMQRLHEEQEKNLRAKVEELTHQLKVEQANAARGQANLPAQPQGNQGEQEVAQKFYIGDESEPEEEQKPAQAAEAKKPTAAQESKSVNELEELQLDAIQEYGELIDLEIKGMWEESRLHSLASQKQVQEAEMKAALLEEELVEALTKVEMLQTLLHESATDADELRDVLGKCRERVLKLEEQDREMRKILMEAHDMHKKRKEKLAATQWMNSWLHVKVNKVKDQAEDYKNKHKEMLDLCRKLERVADQEKEKAARAVQTAEMNESQFSKLEFQVKKANEEVVKQRDEVKAWKKQCEEWEKKCEKLEDELASGDFASSGGYSPGGPSPRNSQATGTTLAAVNKWTQQEYFDYCKTLEEEVKYLKAAANGEAGTYSVTEWSAWCQELERENEELKKQLDGFVDVEKNERRARGVKLDPALDPVADRQAQSGMRALAARRRSQASQKSATSGAAQ